MNAPTNQTAGYFITAGLGLGIAVPDNHRMVKIPEKIAQIAGQKAKRGKGKTIAFCIIPNITNPISTEDCQILMPMIRETLSDLQRDIIVRVSRESGKVVTDSDIGVSACFAEWTNKSFNNDTVGAWFDSECRDLLAFQICTAKGYDPEKLDDSKEQFEFVENRVSAYRASYVEVSSKFPSLNPNQCAELLRVLDLLELSGAIVSKIRDKITPKDTKTSLGFV